MFAFVKRAELIQRSHANGWPRTTIRVDILGSRFGEYHIHDDDVGQNLTGAPIHVRQGRVEGEADLQKTEVAERVGVALEFSHRAGPLAELRGTFVRYSLDSRW